MNLVALCKWRCQTTFHSNRTKESGTPARALRPWVPITRNAKHKSAGLPWNVLFHQAQLLLLSTQAVRMGHQRSFLEG